LNKMLGMRTDGVVEEFDEVVQQETFRKTKSNFQVEEELDRGLELIRFQHHSHHFRYLQTKAKSEAEKHKSTWGGINGVF
jgi:hypothetical protein